MILDALKAVAVLFVAVLIQVSILDVYTPLGGHGRPRARRRCISIALLRGSIFGALAGFGAGLPDRHREPRHARVHLAPAHARRASGPAATARRPPATASTRRSSSVAVITVLYGIGTLALNFVLGEPAPAGAVPLRACRRPCS